ncbi:MAG: hypothetical protein IKO55_04630 [Kiritimatiellae bacterium]|nr:hypothetical protein [Kiritimatiellia bacterium]
MRRLKRSECCILSLVLKRKWYEMIDSGEKREEYRLATDYWKTRIWNWDYKSAVKVVLPSVVEFRLGYAADAPRMAFLTERSFFRMRGNYMHPAWGEPMDDNHIVIAIGERIILEEQHHG